MKICDIRGEGTYKGVQCRGVVHELIGESCRSQSLVAPLTNSP